MLAEGELRRCVLHDHSRQHGRQLRLQWRGCGSCCLFSLGLLSTPSALRSCTRSYPVDPCTFKGPGLPTACLPPSTPAECKTAKNPSTPPAAQKPQGVALLRLPLQHLAPAPPAAPWLHLVSHAAPPGLARASCSPFCAHVQAAPGDGWACSVRDCACPRVHLCLMHLPCGHNGAAPIPRPHLAQAHACLAASALTCCTCPHLLHLKKLAAPEKTCCTRPHLLHLPSLAAHALTCCT